MRSIRPAILIVTLIAVGLLLSGGLIVWLASGVGPGPGPLFPVAITVLILANTAAILVAAVHGLWRPAMAEFPARPPAEDAVRRSFQSFQANLLNLGLSVHVAVDETFLHLTPIAPLRWAGATPASIPWDRMTPAGTRGRAVRIGALRIRGPAWCLRLAAGPADDGAGPGG